MTSFNLRRSLVGQPTIDPFIDMMLDAPEHIQNGFYAYLCILDDKLYKDGAFTSRTGEDLWESVFEHNASDVFVYGNPYSYIQYLKGNEYEKAIFAYIKRSELYYKLLSTLKSLKTKFAFRFANSDDIKKYLIEIQCPQESTALISQLNAAIEPLNRKYSFIRFERKLLKRKDTVMSKMFASSENADDEMIVLEISFIKELTKNIKLDAEYKRLMIFDTIEASDYIYRNGIDFEDTDVIRDSKKNAMVENLAKYFYSSNPLESAKNQVYKLYREAKQRVFEDGLEVYFW